MSPLKKVLRLSPEDRRLLYRSSLLIVGARLLLAVLPFGKTLALVRRWTPPASARPAGHEVPSERLVWAVRAASRRLAPHDKPCLTQALALLVLFRRHGYPARLCIGISKEGTQALQAHAWVVSEDRVVIGALPDLAGYTTLPSLEL